MMSRKIYADPDAAGIDFEPGEWRIAEPGHYLTHLPTSTVFCIGLDEDASRGETARIFDFYARVVHVCPRKHAPDQDTLVKLGRAAIAVCLIEIGAWKPKIVEVPVRRCRRRHGPMVN
jgi:hypothetical protein